MRMILMLSALLSLTTISATGGEHLRINVSPLMSFAPSNIRILTRLVPDDENRTLDVVAESAEFYRSSQIPLEGDRAPAIITVEFRDLPRGEYEVYSVLTDRVGERRAVARQRVTVIARGGE
jgi:hypothetical protein